MQMDWVRLPRASTLSTGIAYVALQNPHPTRDEVAQQNYERLWSLKGHEMCYTSEDTSGRDIDGKWYFPDPEKLLDVLNKAGSLTRSLTTT